MNEKPMVSICSTTYNLAPFISQAIDSWLMQKTNFEVEIIICDDCSTDKTVEIIEKYRKLNYDKIRLITSEQNLGMLPNFIKSLNAAQGKYIAVCDGDDYWTDPNKLQKQVDFLEANPDFSSCYTNSIIKEDITGVEKIAKINTWDVANTKELLLHDDFDKDNIPLSPGHISNFMFRNFLITQFPPWFYKCDNVTDFPLYMMLSQFGKAKFLNEVTGVYRIHSKGTSTVKFDYINFHLGRIFIYNNVNSFFKNKYKKQICPLISKHYIMIFKIKYKNRQIITATWNLFKAFYYDWKQILNVFSKSLKSLA